MAVAKVIGVAWASVVEILGIAKASAKKVIGVETAAPTPSGWSDPILQIGATAQDGGTVPWTQALTGSVGVANLSQLDDLDVTLDGCYFGKGDIGSAWIKADIGFQQIVKRITLHGDSSYTTRNTKRVKIEASTDDSTWVTLNADFAMTQTGASACNLYDNETAYRYYRFTPLENWGDGSFVEFGKIWLQADADDWPYKLNSRSYGTYTANNTLNGEARNLGRWDNGDFWQSALVAGNWVKVDFGANNAKKAVKCQLQYATAASSSRMIKEFSIEGSNNNADWTLLCSNETANNNNLQTFDFAIATGYYRYYRINIASNHGDALLCQGKWTLLGVAAP